MEVPFVKPESIQVEYESPTVGRYVFVPLEPGYGITLGNAYRRVLLSSLEGYAIGVLRIPKVNHEFSTIKGVIEDVVDIVLNLKQVALRPLIKEETTIFVTIENKEVFKAGDIQDFTPAFEVTNPDLVIAHLSHKNVKLEMELRVLKGRGYRTSEENKKLLEATKQPNGDVSSSIGEIVLDTLFSPVVRVVPRVTSTLYNQRADYEQLTLEIETNGALTPREALLQASKILVECFSLGVQQSAVSVSAPPPSPIPSPSHLREKLSESIEKLGITARYYNALRQAGIYTLYDLVTKSPEELSHIRNIGATGHQEILQALEKLDLSLGMKI
ncbi:MAG: DNA-directed RNA polymerase subunit alpha [Bacteroidia bacterium]